MNKWALIKPDKIPHSTEIDEEFWSYLNKGDKILDIGCGNIGSLKNALDFLNIENKIIKNASEIQEAESLILPGDGSFKILRSIYDKGYFEPLNAHIKKNKPLYYMINEIMI